MRLFVLLTASLLAAMLILSFAPRGASADPTPARASGFAPSSITATVQVGPNNSTSFVPATQVVDVGDTVHWVWSSTFIPHAIVSGTCPGGICTADGKFQSNGGVPQTAPASYDFTFTAPGVYPYFCGVHQAAMQGVIFVSITHLFLPLIIR